MISHLVAAAGGGGGENKGKISSTELTKHWSRWRKNHAKRRFILCTNNEIKKDTLDKLKKQKDWTPEKESDHREGICKKITYPRLKGISNGYKWNPIQVQKLVHPISSRGSIMEYKKSFGDRMPKISFRLKHFKIELFSWKSTIKCKIDFSKRAIELLCLKEECFKKIYVEKNNKFQIYRDHNGHYLGIIFNPEFIPAFENKIQTLKEIKLINTYVFSINGTIDKSHFIKTQDMINLKAIPTAIIEMYKKIVRDL